MKIALSKSLRNHQTFKLNENHSNIDDTISENEQPSFLVSLLPIVVLLGIILIFSTVNHIIIIALIAAILLSALLFRKQITEQKEMLNKGANESLSSVITTGSTIAFGSIATSVPAFSGVFQ